MWSNVIAIYVVYDEGLWFTEEGRIKIKPVLIVRYWR